MMYLENLDEQIEDWFEQAETEDTLKFLGNNNSFDLKNPIIIEMLGYYGSVDQLIANEIQKINVHKTKLAGLFSNYLNEMIQLSSNEILLPITLLHFKIEDQDYILVSTSFPIPDIIGYQLSEELYKFYKKINSSKIILIDGVHTNERDIDIKPKVHKITSSDFQMNLNKKEYKEKSKYNQNIEDCKKVWWDINLKVH